MEKAAVQVVVDQAGHEAQKETLAKLEIALEEQRRQLSKVESAFGESALDIVDKILRQNVGALGLQKIGEVTEPVRACVLAAPPAARS